MVIFSLDNESQIMITFPNMAVLLKYRLLTTLSLHGLQQLSAYKCFLYCFGFLIYIQQITKKIKNPHTCSTQQGFIYIYSIHNHVS